MWPEILIVLSHIYSEGRCFAVSREVLDVLKKLEDKILFLPFDRESDYFIVDGQRFNHQDLMADIY